MLATLGIEIVSKGAKEAAADLDKVTAASARVESATQKSGKVASSAYTEAAKGISEYQRSVQQATSNVIPFHRSIEDTAKVAKATGFQMRQLGFQVNDIATGLLSGQSPFQVLAQQGGQVYQVLQMGPNGVGGSLQAIKAQILGLITPTTLFVAGLTGVAAVIAGGLISAMNYAKSLDDLSRITGIAAEKLEGLQKAAAIKGIDSEVLSAGVKAFTSNIDDARFKTNDLRKLFELNGQTIKDNMAANLETVAKLIKNAETDLDRLRIAQIAGFEKSADTLRFFEQIGEAGVQAVAGVSSAVDRDLIQKSRAFSEAWATAWSEFKTSAQSAVASAFTGLQSLVDKATDAYLQYSGRELDPSSRVRRGFDNAGSFADTDLQNGLEKYASKLRELNGIQEKATTKVNIYGKEAKSAHEKAEKAVKEEKEEISLLQTASTNFVQSFVSGIIDGKNAVESLGKALAGLGSSLLNSGIKDAIESIFSGSSGLITQITGSLGIGNLGNLLGLGSGFAMGGVTALLGAGISFIPKLLGGDGKSAKDIQKAADDLAKAQQSWRDMASDFSSWIHDWTTGVSGDLHSAISSARSQMQQFANAASAAHDPGGVAAAQTAFNIGVSRSINEALDALLTLGIETSSYSQKLKEAKDKAEDIRLTLIEFGTAAETAALAVETRLTVAIERLRGQFLDDLVRKVNELAGGAWINQLTDLVGEVAQLRTDAAALGIQTSLIDEYFVRAAQNIINENELVGSAFDAVTATLGPLGAGLHEFQAAAEDAAQSLKRSAQEIASTIQSYQDQLFIAQQDAGTLSGALAIFDLQAQRAVEQEIAAGGEALAALQALQEQQRLNIIIDFNQRALEEQQRLQDEQNRLQEQQRRELEQTIEKQKQYVASLQSLKASLFLGANSTLSPRDQLAYAQSQFASVTRSAAAGDENARGQIQSATNAYLEAARAYYGSSDAYASIFTSVQNTLDSLIASGANSVSTAERQLSQMQTQTSLLSSINDNISAMSNGVYGAASTPTSAAGIDLSWMSSLPGFPAYANGTDFHRGGMAIVGERGPEIVNLPRGSRVTPTNDNGDAMTIIANKLERILAVLSAGERMNAEESARTTEAVRTLSRQISTSGLSRARAS